MRISEVSIQNYRSFGKEAKVISFPDLKKPVSIVGHNNCGKSNIIKAILHACGQRARIKFEKDDFHRLATSDSIEIKVMFNEAIPVPTIYKGKSADCFGSRLEVEYLDVEAVGYPNAIDKDGEIVRIQEHLKGPGKPVSFARYREALGLFYIDFKNIDHHLKISSYSLLGKAIEEAKKEFKDPANRIADKAGNEKSRLQHFEALLLNIEERLLSTEKLKLLVKSIEDAVKKYIELDDDSVKVSFKLPESDELYDSLTFRVSDNKEKKTIPLENLGDGFRAILITAILKTLLDTDTGGRVIILEEPETYLHEHFQEYFYQILCKISENNQVIYTTHSKKFIDPFEPKSIIRVINDDYLESIIAQPDESELNQSIDEDDVLISNPADFRKYVLSIEPNLGNIVFASKVIVVEGPDDLLAYKLALSKKINFGLNNIAIVQVGGKDPIVSVVQICNHFKIPVYAIHEYDLENSVDPHQLPAPTDEKERKGWQVAKAHWTKNKKISDVIGDPNRVHSNKVNLEAVLGIERKNKGSISVFEKLHSTGFDEIIRNHPTFIPMSLLKYLELE